MERKTKKPLLCNNIQRERLQLGLGRTRADKFCWHGHSKIAAAAHPPGQTLRKTSMDKLLTAADAALRTLFAAPRAIEDSPAHALEPMPLTPEEKRLSGALMRVNHV